jgi:hypothetical protein
MLLASFGLWALLVVGWSTAFSRPPKRTVYIFDVGLTNLLLILLLLELVLAVWARNSTSPLFWDVGSMKSTLDKYRLKPHQKFFDFAFNSRGYHDTEFFIAEEGDFVVGLLSDSFGVGVVPYRHNFATILENKLRVALRKKYNRVAVHNFSIPCIEMPEYAYLMRTEVQTTNPSQVILCAFIGNDIRGLARRKKRRYCFQNWWFWILPKRVWTVMKEERKGLTRKAPGDTVKPNPVSSDSDTGFVIELCTFSEEKFLEVEGERLKICNPHGRRVQRNFRGFFKALEAFRALLGDKFLLVVIPDEFQVNDELYARVLKTMENPEVYIRDYPQQRICAYCTRHKIRVLDLLPFLRKAQKKGRTYRLRDTHWNERGNRIAGEEIAKYILKYVIPREQK